MELHDSFARRLRLGRLHRRRDERLFVVPLDHSVTTGPIAGRQGMHGLVRQLTAAGVDALVLHKGVLRHLDPALLVNTSLVVHLSASTQHAPDPDAKYLVSSVEEALRLGADAVSTHLNLGSPDERRQVADLAGVADACDRWNLPLMSMVYPRGPGIADPHDPDLVAHSVTLAADLGADVVKTVLPKPVTALADITSAAPVPVIVAGGPPADSPETVLNYVRSALDHGAAGVAMGRNVFQAEDPADMARRVADVVHRGGQITSTSDAGQRVLAPSLA